MKDITSVSLTEEVSARILPILIWLLALIHLFVNIEFISSSLFGNRLLDSFIIALVGYIVNKFYKDHYYVTITNNSTQINTVESTSKAYISIIIEALNQAIIKRG